MSDNWTPSPCQSYQDGAFTCLDGWFQKPFCRGHWKCDCCAAPITKNLPSCLLEEVTAHMNDDGSPRYYQDCEKGHRS